MPAVAITDASFVATTDGDRARGLLFFASFTFGPFKFDGVTVRRTRDDRLALSWPACCDARGTHHYYVRPVDDAARLEIERQVFLALHLKQETSP